MAFTETYVKVDSAAWDTDTVYAPDDQVVGTDDNNYYCILAQDADQDAQPTTGADYATYWAEADGTSEVKAWNFGQMIAATPAAETRVNIKAGSYSEGATTLPSNGTAIQPIVLRGYNSTIGDLDNQGRNADGTLNTANMPDITITDTWVPSAYCVLQNLDITGALSSTLIISGSADYIALINCNVVNSENNSGARVLLVNNYAKLVNCDFSCTGAAHGVVVECDLLSGFVGCRFAGTENDEVLLRCHCGTIARCMFLGAGGTSVGIDFDTQHVSGCVVTDCSFYNLGTAINGPNAVASGMWVLHGNHVTDCAKYLDNPYVATSQQPVIEAYNRTRDNTTPRTGILSSVLAGEVTTDDGDYTTDYVSATNLRLISTAAGKNAGMMPYADIGAHGCAAPTIPAEEDVEAAVEYGYADDLQTGTLVAGGGAKIIGG